MGHSPLNRLESGESEISLFVKYTLFALNVLFWLLGGLSLGVGVYAKTAKDLGTMADNLPWFMDPANLFIIIGLIVFILAFLGCIGALRENITILKTFEYTIDVLLLLEIVAAIYVYIDRKRVKANIQDLLRDTIPKYRDSLDLQSIMDWTQENMQCCGIENSNDWEDSVYFNCKSKSFEACSVPYSCCKNYATELNTLCGIGTRKKVDSKIYTEGCVDAVINYFLNDDNLVLLVCIAGAMLLLQLVTTGLAHHLVVGIRRQKALWQQHFPYSANEA